MTNTNPTSATLTQVVHREILAVPSLDNVQAETVVMAPAAAQITAATFNKKGVELYLLKTLPADDEPRRFVVVRTGTAVPHGGLAKFHTTVVLPGTPALHVFELL